MKSSSVLMISSLVFCFSNALAAYTPVPESEKTYLGKIEPFCPSSAVAEWRKAYSIEGVDIAPSPVCQPDNPYAIATFVKGTNNISMATLMKTRIAQDALIKKNDLDGDGDPDEIHIRLEVIELNGKSPDLAEPVVSYDIAPGISPGFWVFAPKSRGMSTVSFASVQANPLLRAPSPTIRVEQGDKVIVTLENSHYFPHSIHFHGVDHPFQRSDGQGNDGVPQTSNKLTMPGRVFSYELQPRQTGTMIYHCHVQAHSHILMGLIGLFVVEENKPNNWLQTFNIGAGKVRYPSRAVSAQYSQEYDLLYQDLDKQLNDRIQQYNDTRLLAKSINRDYNITQRTPEYFILNGRSFPYTLRESLIVVQPEEKVKLRVFNAGEEPVNLHMHGFKPTATHFDGVKLQQPIQRDVFSLSAAQRADLELYALNDGLNNMGEGVWTYHDHNEKAVTTNGIYPGGHISSVVFASFLGENGMPKLQGVDVSPFFTQQFYQKKYPVWGQSDQNLFYADLKKKPKVEGGFSWPDFEPVQIAILGLQLLLLVYMMVLLRRMQKNHE
jgi:hypothetical protein